MNGPSPTVGSRSNGTLIDVWIVRENVGRHHVVRLIALGEERIDERRKGRFKCTTTLRSSGVSIARTMS